MYVQCPNIMVEGEGGQQDIELHIKNVQLLIRFCIWQASPKGDPELEN